MSRAVSEARGISRNFLGAGVLLVWLCLMATLFWVFQFKYISNWVSFEGAAFETVSLVDRASRSTVVHFVDPDCPCTRFSQPHIEEIETRWEGLAFKTVTAGASHELNSLLGQYIPASPAVAMWDESGQLQYFGPYTAGEICGEGEDLLSKALVSQGKGQWLNQEAVGCFCPWSAGVNG